MKLVIFPSNIDRFISIAVDYWSPNQIRISFQPIAFISGRFQPNSTTIDSIPDESRPIQGNTRWISSISNQKLTQECNFETHLVILPKPIELEFETSQPHFEAIQSDECCLLLGISVIFSCCRSSSLGFHQTTMDIVYLVI